MKWKRKVTGGVNPLLQLAVFALALCIVGLLAYRQFGRLKGSKRPVVIATANLTVGSLLSKADVKTLNLRENEVAESAMFREKDVMGLRLMRAKAEGEIIHAEDLALPKKKSNSLASRIPEGRVLTTLTLRNKSIPPGGIENGDYVDVVIAGRDANKKPAARVLVRGAFVLGYTGAPQQKSAASKGPLGMAIANQNNKKPENIGLLVAVRPQDVIPLAEVDSAGLHVNLVLHSKSEVQNRQLLTVTGRSTPKTVEIITGDKVESIIVQ